MNNSSKENFNKKEFGQFFTTNVNYILNGMEGFVKNKNVTDPFAGKCDLLNWAKCNGSNNITGFDIDIKLINDIVKLNDSLISMPKCDFIITNPPYLAKNKMSKNQKDLYLKRYDDFYLLSISNIIKSNCKEGIIIVPINFFSAENSDSLRKEFLSIYNIDKINYFKEQVFKDTTYNVVSFHFLMEESANDRVLKITSFPDEKYNEYIVSKKYSYKIGGEDLYKIINSKKLKIKRLTENIIDKQNGQFKIDCFLNDYKTNKIYSINKNLKEKIDNNIIILNCIDGKIDNKINSEDIRKYNKSCLIGKNTSRNIAYILLDDVNIQTQLKMIKMFNEILNELRTKYNSLFLTNFRDNDRKRISFDFCYCLLSYCYEQISNI